ncbi:MAG: hypothetical protein Q8N88_04755 [Nanoarchaeota archaeon]|nr:hypothetical protein [Nanoarchaeota archaeon]
MKDKKTKNQNIMAAIKFHVKLEGKSQLHEPVIKLEGIEVNIWSVDGGLTWENKDVTLEVTGKLEIDMSCKAISGTGWEFFVKNKESDKKVYETEGATGEALESRNGQRVANFSERKTSVNS